MGIVFYPALLGSAVGLALSARAHIMALAGMAMPGDSDTFYFDLVVGCVICVTFAMLAVWPVAFAVTSRKEFWRAALAGCPVWMRVIEKGLTVYGYLAMILFALTDFTRHLPKGSSPELMGALTGVLMMLYSTAFVVLYSAVRGRR